MVASVLERPALVLNRNWQPVNVATVARALTLVWNDNARVVCPETYQLFDWCDWSNIQPEDGEPSVRSTQQLIRAPEVVALTGFDRLPKAHVAFSRRNIFKRDQFKCQYCGVRPRPDELTIDHIVPRAQGGQSTWDNCVLACIDCNHSKADRTPEQARMTLSKVAKRPNWSPAYSRHTVRLDSWQKFISDAYWNAELS